MNNNHEQIDALLNHIHNGDTVEAENVFNALMQEKVDAFLNGAKEEVAASMFNTEDCADCSEEQVDEALKGNQHKIDANKNGKIDAQDFKMLRKKKMKEAYADPYAAKKAAEMKKKKEEAMAAAKKEYDASQESKGKVNTKSFMKMKEEAETVEENKYSLPAGSTMKPGYKKPKSALEKRFGHLKPGESASLKGDPKKVMKKEEVEIDEASYSAKMARAGKDIGKPGKMFAKIAKKASRKYGKARGEKIAGAVLAKLRKKGK